jgi:hypothetical protein
MENSIRAESLSVKQRNHNTKATDPRDHWPHPLQSQSHRKTHIPMRRELPTIVKINAGGRFID